MATAAGMVSSSASGNAGAKYERNQEATIFVGNLDQQADEELLWELFMQVGPVVDVKIPRDRITNTHSGYAFVEFKHEHDANYAIQVMNQIKLFGRPMKLNRYDQDKSAKNLDVGANLWIGNLDPSIGDETILRELFGRFGVMIQNTPRIQRDPETNESKGFAFVSYDNFESSDAAKMYMNGQYIGGRPIIVEYAFKPNSRERYGSEAERQLAANRPLTQQQQQMRLNHMQQQLQAQQMMALQQLQQQPQPAGGVVFMIPTTTQPVQGAVLMPQQPQQLQPQYFIATNPNHPTMQ
ncbi:hypothetical protein C9374_012003 [Naegleria lovaniensis]|uniref:RRM domain-containing protein n=1 Tax=Naegleria lovaniensis TaxID=51637 RepID=A0AA88GDQ2_NAELO|nr:uncharacterized protein C9374_012003 [Naegleria lovaniensis]KAG2373540.1 hypothetical protein C9374_012003 [Naegleria lovaniensis]